MSIAGPLCFPPVSKQSRNAPLRVDTADLKGGNKAPKFGL